jgi:hypothetical protein
LIQDSTEAPDPTPCEADNHARIALEYLRAPDPQKELAESLGEIQQNAKTLSHRESALDFRPPLIQDSGKSKGEIFLAPEKVRQPVDTWPDYDLAFCLEYGLEYRPRKVESAQYMPETGCDTGPQIGIPANDMTTRPFIDPREAPKKPAQGKPFFGPFPISSDGETGHA